MEKKQLDMFPQNGNKNAHQEQSNETSKFISPDELLEEIQEAGGEVPLDPAFEGSIGVTMFDTPGSKDNQVSVLVPKKHIVDVPSQSLVQVNSRSDGDARCYRGVVVEGPFYMPDGLRADSTAIIATASNGMTFMPKYHGRVMVDIIGEIIEDTMMPPRFRPLPNSPVKVLGREAVIEVLKVKGNIEIGLLVGHDDILVGIPADSKLVLPRHIGILGTTGGGKSTTVSGFIGELQKSGVATIMFDTEGEYTHIDKPTEDEKMQKLLEKLGKKPTAVRNVQVYHLVGKETTAKSPTPKKSFSLSFSDISPYLASELMDLTSAQIDRFFKAYEVTKQILRDVKVFPKSPEDEQRALEIDEFDTGYPHITLSFLIDICGLLLNKVEKNEEYNPYDFRLKNRKSVVLGRINKVKTDSAASWRALLSKLWQMHKTKIFDVPRTSPMDFKEILQPGKVTIIDLSDTDSTLINNLTISSILRTVLSEQDKLYIENIKSGEQPLTTMIIIEEAHEFLSKERISKMPHLFQQVARIAKRGRKRRLGMAFVTQLPQNLPNDVLGLLNSYIIHKIGDANVISRLRKNIGGVDDSLWNKVSNLPVGQAVISSPSLTRPVLVAVNPTPHKLLMVD